MDIKEIAEDLIRKEKYDEALKTLDSHLKKEFNGKTTLKGLKGYDRKTLLRLLQLKANAYARRGQLRESQKILKPLIKDDPKNSETRGLYARTFKDLYYRSGRKEDLREARDQYAKTFAPDGNGQSLEDHAYVGINAAAMSVLLGERNKALNFSDRLTAAIGTPDQKNYWLTASVAEAELIRALYAVKADRGKAFERAAELYSIAVNGSPEERGSHGSTWLQARRLMRAKRVPEQYQSRIWFAFRHLTDDAPYEEIWQPPFRRLRVYAFDPNWAKQLETAAVNELVLNVKWEERQERDDKGNAICQPHLRGPVGEYLEIVDIDPASGCVYEPIDLNDRRLLSMDGKGPSVGDPQFHQQMVYAVGMNVIASFEKALGRKALWSSRKIRDDKGKVTGEEFVRRLRVYPHALREANAYYSPTKKALLFGYFPAEADDPLLLPGGSVFTCLSHDIIAHEMSHALMDGLHPRFTEATNVDVLAFHEAFSDIVALFQHFSHPEVLRHEVSRTRGQLTVDTHLGQLAQEFGRAIGQRGALRDAIGKRGEDGKWQRQKPDPDALLITREPHGRGAILVAAIFDAFLSIYESRTRDLVRIATQGSGILAPGEIHPDLVNRLANEAAKAARQILRICIRALDYCPPVDITFGDYLRAMITADVDAVPNDKYGYRLALIESFNRRGIHPEDARNLSVESLVWRPPRGNRIDMSGIFTSARGKPAVTPEWRATGTREELYNMMRENAKVMHGWLMNRCPAEVADEIGLHLESDAPSSFYFKRNRPTVEVHSVRVAQRMQPDGSMHTDLVVEVMQRRRGYKDKNKQADIDNGSKKLPQTERGDFTFRGGCTLLIDPAEGRVRYAINKHILSDNRLNRQRDFLYGTESSGRSLRATYFGDKRRETYFDEPFAILHRPLDI